MLDIYDLAELLNLEPSDDLFFEAFPISDEVIIIRFADQTDATCAYCKIEELQMIHGGIIMWHGLLADIPDNYVLCDGENGTPDLREKFVRGSADSVDPGAVGGSVNHTHDFTGDGHDNPLVEGPTVQSGEGYEYYDNLGVATGTTDAKDGRPPFYDIAYIMRL